MNTSNRPAPVHGDHYYQDRSELFIDPSVPWSLLIKDMPNDKHSDLDYIVDQLDWDANVDPNFKCNHYVEPISTNQFEPAGPCVDKWITYGRINQKQYFSAKELTLEPGASCTVVDNGTFGLIAVQGEGTINEQHLASPTLIRFNELTQDEVFITHSAAQAGVRYENTSESEPLVTLRYFGPEVNPDAPQIGDHMQL